MRKERGEEEVRKMRDEVFEVVEGWDESVLERDVA